MSNLYTIDGKKATQKQWYEHLEKMYMKQMPHAELGRLALATRAMVCSNSDFIKRGAKQCEKHCTNYKYCKLRAELLVEVPHES
jgi:hypothetical protein